MTSCNPETLSSQVREAQLSQYNYVFVVGEQERPGCLVNVRTRDNVVHGMQRVTSSPQKKVLILSSSHSDSVLVHR